MDSEKRRGRQGTVGDFGGGARTRRANSRLQATAWPGNATGQTWPSF